MTNKNFHMKYGLFTALAMIAVGLILHVTDMSFAPWAQYVTYAPMLIGVIMCCVAYSNARDNEVSFGQVFGVGFKTSAIVTLIMVAWGLISILVFPEIKDKALEMAYQRMAERGVSDEIAEQSMNLTKKYFYPFMIGGVILGTLFYGAVFSLIGALVARKKPKMPTIQP